jgi:hypothetical protein
MISIELIKVCSIFRWVAEKCVKSQKIKLIPLGTFHRWNGGSAKNIRILMKLIPCVPSLF